MVTIVQVLQPLLLDLTSQPSTQPASSFDTSNREWRQPNHNTETKTRTAEMKQSNSSSPTLTTYFEASIRSRRWPRI